ncbi:protein of unassigned function [Methylobacterium oryzae CBMB20]|uniref:Protein of unassigned function n=1 Tax=Methylobacterium oryzae CBMB20 TaxID=693986 RepID=A0A089NLE8_9HYPH|nr:protein of unassigned function [Methylobacterium oryzae CBMB20]
MLRHREANVRWRLVGLSSKKFVREKYKSLGRMIKIGRCAGDKN